MKNEFSVFSDVKWVFFDLDDTLWDFRSASEIALKRLYAEHNIFNTNFDSYDAFANVYHRVNATLWDRYHHGEISQDYLKIERFKRLLPKRTLGENVCIELNEEYLDILSSQPLPMEGALETLLFLQHRYLIGVLTNGFITTQYAKLNVSRLDQYVQRMVVSDEISVQKPSRQLFEYALQATGATTSDAIMVGDNPETDILGAIRSGWRAIYFDRTERGVPEGVRPHAIIKKLTDLKKML